MTGAPTGDSRPASQQPLERAGEMDFNRHRRIVRSADFQRIFKEGRKSVGKYLIIWQAKPGLGRLGVVASRRTFRRAVDRNRAKRLMRESYRLLRADAGCDDVDIVLVGRRAILDVKRQVVDGELEGLISSYDRAK